MASHEQLYAVKEPLALTELFEPKDDTQTPNKILILGRAGIGKSILCQYLATQWASDATGFAAKDEEVKEISVTDHLQQKFDAVFWLKLREVAAKTTNRDTLLDVLDRFCLKGLKKDKPTEAELSSYIDEHSDKILFILDGYDEIIDRIDQPAYRYLNRILAEIASQQHVLLTSRPITIDTLGSQPIQFDRRLENMGFLNENIEAYVHRFMHTAQKPEQVMQMLNFLKSHPGVWGIAHIPINLELLCWLWSKGELIFAKNEIVTLSKLYQIVVECIQEKYIEKACEAPDILALNEPIEIKEESVTIADCANIFLERLAYDSMETESLFISSAYIKVALEKTLIQYRQPLNTAYKTQLLRAAAHKFGLLRPTAQGGKSQLNQEHYFIHLSFQEFYAAKYISRILSEHPHSEESENVLQRILTEKYTPRYQLMLWMSAGLLYQQGKKSQQFSSLLCFWRAILSQPRDMIGFHHNVLVMHCLDECEADDRLALHKELIAQQHKWFEIYAKRYWRHSLYSEQLAQCSVLLASAPMVAYLLLQALRSSSVPKIRKAAIKTLGYLNILSEAVRQRLPSALQAENEALGELNNPNEPVKTLLNALRDKDWNIRDTVAFMLDNGNHPNKIVLLRVFQDEDKCDRDVTTSVLDKSKHLSEADLRKDWELMKDAIFALGKLNSPSKAVKLLLSTLQMDVATSEPDLREDWEIMKDAIFTLGKLNKPSDAVIEFLLSVLSDANKDVKGAAIEVLLTPKNFDIMRLIFKGLTKNERRSFLYFSHWFGGDRLLLIDHKKGNMVTRQGRQNYSISLPANELICLEKQIFFVAKHKNYPPEFYNLSGYNTSREEKAILQACESGVPMCIVSDAMWLVHLVNKKVGERAFLVIEGIGSEKHLVLRYEFTSSQHISNSSSGFFPPVNSIGRVVKAEDFLDELEQNKKSYLCKSWNIEPAMGQRLLELLEADIGESIPYGMLDGTFSGATSVSSLRIPRYDCLTWAEAKLKAIGLPVGGRWTDLTIVLSAIVAEQDDIAADSACEADPEPAMAEERDGKTEIPFVTAPVHHAEGMAEKMRQRGLFVTAVPKQQIAQSEVGLAELEKSREELLKGTAYKKFPSVRNLEELNSLIERLEKAKADLEELGDDFPAERAAHLKRCQKAAEELLKIDEKIKNFQKNMQYAKSGLEASYLNS
jgi:hypothetical protein